ncbi:terpene synthase metal-binding domain-containing protein (plasmid) [Fischerella sp. NIES-4106]|nr:terpene synthase metal-binding domain-containing protein [Fischerella sp. NIES-4106]
MNQLTMTDLYCPFVYQCNQYADVLEDYALQWVLRFNLLTNESSYQSFSKSKISFLVASAYPHCEFEELKIANDWLSWVFIWDDQCDMSNLGKQPEALKSFRNKFIEILNGAEPSTQDIPLCHALNDLRQRMLIWGSEEWFHYFICSMKDYLNSCIQEAINRVHMTILNVNDYINLRMSTVAMYSAIELIEICNHLRLTNSLRKYYAVKKLRQMTVKILGWCNDIFSIHREIKSNDFHNLVMVIHYQQKASLAEAIECAIKMHNEEVQAMLDVEKFLPSFGREIDIELAKYISGMHAWIRGNLEWYSHSGRYQTAETLNTVTF